MGRYLLGRLAAALPTLVLLTLVAFLLTSAARGDPAEAALRQSGMEPTPEEIAAYRQRLGLDAPLAVRYGRWLRDLAGGNLGTSFLSGRPVGAIIAERLGPTLLLGGTAFAVTSLLGIGLGIAFGITAESRLDRWGRVVTLLLAALPSFWLALLLITLVAERWRLLPVAGYGGVRHLILPVAALACGPVASLMRLTRAATIEAWRQDYVRTARAKGLPAVAIALRHALPNALLPIVTLLGLRFGQLLAGAVVIEAIFAWPGMGSALVAAISGRDLPVIGAYVLCTGVAFVAVNLLVDLAYAALDPRIRLGAEQGGRR